jgi:hypothetical protein
LMEFIQEIKLIYCFKNRTTHPGLTWHPSMKYRDSYKK